MAAGWVEDTVLPRRVGIAHQEHQLLDVALRVENIVEWARVVMPGHMMTETGHGKN